jgi:hypothetical protein
MTITLNQLNNTGSPLTDVAGNVLSNTVVTFTLVDSQGNPTDTFDATDFARICGSTTATTSSTGEFTVYLWPNDRGTTNTMYKCTITGIAPVMGVMLQALPITTWFLFKTTPNSYTPTQATALTAEIARAQAAEATLQNNINLEAVTRAANDLTAGITGGTINGATVGATNPSTGVFTTLQATTTFTAPSLSTAPTAIQGSLYYNTVTNQWQGYNGLTWSQIGGGAVGGGTDAAFLEIDAVVSQNWTIGSGAYVSGVTYLGSANTLVLTTHGFVLDSFVHFSTTGALPTGLAIDTPYYVISGGLTTNNFQVSLTSGGTAVAITGAGTGTHSVGKIKNAVVGSPFTTASGVTVTVPSGSTLTVA